MGSTGSRRSCTVLLAALVVAGCGRVGTSASPANEPSPSTTPAPTTTAEPSPAAVATLQPRIEPTAEPTIEPDPTDRPCPTAEILTVTEFLGAKPSCFGDEPFKLRAWADHAPATGFEGPAHIEPRWLYYPDENWTVLWNAAPVGPDQQCPDDNPDCDGFFPHINPDSGLSFLPLGRWVITTGHLRDPAAERCHYVYPDDWTGPKADDIQAIRRCRTHFVVTAVEETS